MNNDDDTLEEKADRWLFVIQPREEVEEEKEVILCFKKITRKLILRLRRRLVLKLKRRLIDLENDLENQEIRGEVNIQNSHNFFHEV